MLLSVPSTTAPPPGVYTSTYVIANFSPATYAGKNVDTSDMGLMVSDGVRWLCNGTPPIPPGAALLGYNKNIYTVFPVLADITFGGATTKSRLYSGWGPYGTPPTSAAFGTDPVTGQLQLFYPSGTNANSAVMTTMNATNSQASPVGNLGMLPYALGSKGFHFEAAYTIPTDNPDSFFAFFI